MECAYDFAQAEAKVAKDAGDHETALEKLTEAAKRKSAQSEAPFAMIWQA